MSIDKINIPEKADNPNKKALLARLGVPQDESLSAQEINRLVGKTNELVEKTNELDQKFDAYKPVNAFNFKENKSTYADLASIVDPQKDDAYGVLADGLIYIFNGTSWPTEGNGLDLKLRPTGTVEEGNTQAVSGGEVFSKTIRENDVLEMSRNLFEVEKTELFPEANLTVRRYQADTTFNDYAAGYSQTALADGLRVAIPASGTTSIKHYLRTGFFKIGILKAHFEFSNTAVVGQGAGIGYLDNSGNFVFYHLSGSGQFRKSVNFSNTVNITAGITYDIGDIITYEINNTQIIVTKNGAQSYSHTLDVGEFETEILIGQAGFPQYTVYLQGLSDPIRQYVSSELANFENLPECFYSYDPLAIPSPTAPTNTGMFTVFVRLNGNKYCGYHLGHEVDMRELIYKDYWRIRNASIYEYNGSQMLITTNTALANGESECVWKRNSTKDDFTGGTHGDELVTEILFFANGVQIDNSLLDNPIPLTACNSFYYLEKSTMHATAENEIPIAGHPIECYHLKKTDFKNKGYKTFNELTWVEPGLVTLWYHGTCCLSKDIGNVLYSENFEQIESGGFPETPSFREVWYRSDLGSAYITSKILKIKSGTSDETLTKDNDAVLFVSDRTYDNKYYRRMSPTNVLAGDVWQSIMEVKMDLI